MNNQDSYINTIVHRITSALTLIILGIFFLLNTTGVVPWTAWGTVFLIFIRVWPIFIIFAGLQIIFGKNTVLSMLLNIVGSLFFAGVLIVAAYVNISDTKLKTDIEQSINFPISFTVIK